MHVQDSSSFEPLSIRLVSHNIRYATTEPFPGEDLWPKRLPLLLAELNFLARHTTHTFICLQEVLHEQLVDILGGLNNVKTHGSDQSSVDLSNQNVLDDVSNLEWGYIGVGRDDGQKAGEYSPVLYRRRVWSCPSDAWHTTWLSETPNKPSKGWDAASIRILTHGVFTLRNPHEAGAPKMSMSRSQHIDSVRAGMQIVVMSTHLDDQGSQARFQGVGIIRDTIKNYLVPNTQSNRPNPEASLQPLSGSNLGGGIDIVLLGGDFNSEPTDAAYQRMVRNGEKKEEYIMVRDLKDVVETDVQHGIWGYSDTFTDFDESARKTRIDFVFVAEKLQTRDDLGDRSKGKQSVYRPEGLGVMPNVWDEKVFVSDHRAVVGDVGLL